MYMSQKPRITYSANIYKAHVNIIIKQTKNVITADWSRNVTYEKEGEGFHVNLLYFRLLLANIKFLSFPSVYDVVTIDQLKCVTP